MRVLLIPGSLREGSYNRAIADYIAQHYRFSQTVCPALYDGLKSLPIYTPDLDQHDLQSDRSPHTVQQLRHAVKNCDAVLFVTPEYAFEIPGGLKNALDWLVSSGELTYKPVGIITASTSAMGGESANAVLAKLAGVLSADVRNNARLTVEKVNKRIDTAGRIHDARLQKSVQNVVEALMPPSV